MTIKKGQIILPTGTGKTQIMIATLIEDMVEKTKNGQVGTYVVAAHRILLCRQLLERILKEADACGLNFDILSIGSDKLDGDTDVYKDWISRDALNCNILSTTQSQDIGDFLNQAKSKNRHAIIASTYHSLWSLLRYAMENPIDIMLCDEAHTTTQKRFNSCLKDFVQQNATKSVYYFTATPRVKGIDKKPSFGGGGMHNIEVYGPRLCEKSLREMVDQMEIVRPKFHYIEYNKNSSSPMTLSKAIEYAFLWHRNKVKARAKSGSDKLGLTTPETMGAKMLVSCNGISQLKEIFHNPVFQQFCKDKNVKVCAYSSQGCGYGDSTGFIFNTPRKEVYNKMVNFSEIEDAILLHVNILTEGIDIPSITAVMPLRVLETISLLQTCGRAARLCKNDRKRLYDPATRPDDYKKLIKPAYNIVFLKNILDLESESMKRLILDLMDAYKMSYEEMLEEEGFWGDTPEAPESITPNFFNFSSGKSIQPEQFKQWEEEVKLRRMKEMFTDYVETRGLPTALKEITGEN